MSLLDHINAHLAKTAAANQEEATKVAEVELFTKLAAENGIDLDQLSQEQVNELWVAFKTAGEESDEKKDDEKDDEKKEKAKAEFAAKKEASMKIAESDALGRLMARSFMDEVTKIASGRPSAPAQEKVAEAETPATTAPALDQLAAEKAVEKAASADYDPQVAAQRIHAVLVLGAPDSVKVASADTLEQAVEVRALELLELAGYPVQY